MSMFRRATALSVVLAATLALIPSARAQDSGDLPDAPYTLTTDNQVQYANIVLADRRPIVVGENTGEASYSFRRLAQQYKFPIQWTFDAGTVQYLTSKNDLLVYFLQDLANDLITGLNSTQALYLKGPLGKIKEVHLTTTTKRRSSAADITGDGYYPSFNKANGTLTIAFSTSDGPNRLAQGTELSQWVIAHVK